MKEYILKRGYKPDTERILLIIKENFPNAILKEDGKIIASYGAIKLTAFIKDKKMIVETISDPSIKDDAVILDTNTRFRKFLKDATGYTTKERIKNQNK